MTQPGIPNEYAISTSCYGSRLRTIEDQAFASVAMGFRRLELGLADQPVPLNGFEDSRRETGIAVRSMVAGCLDPLGEHISGTQLGATSAEARERALNSVRRHARVALQYECPVIILRGCQVEDADLAARADELVARVRVADLSEDDQLQQEVTDLIGEVQKKGHRQVEHLCRSIHSLYSEFPDIQFAVEPGMGFVDLLHFEAVGWTLDDLSKQGLGYWHDTGRVHQRQLLGLPAHGAWLDAYAPRMIGCHLQDATSSEAEMPPGSGEVDFKLVQSYLNSDIEKVLEIQASHGRAEILAAIRFLVDQGF